MATAFLSISSYMSAAPLNPSYKLKEYEFYLQDLMPKIVIVEKDSQNPAVEAAKNLGIEICEIKKIDNAPAGIFNLYNKTKISNLLLKIMKPWFCIHLEQPQDQKLYH